MKFNVPQIEMTIAQQCVNKDNPREFLRGVYVFKEGYLAATDSRIAYFSRKIEGLQLENDVCFLPVKNKSIPSSAFRVEIDTDALQMNIYNKSNQLDTIVPIEIVESKRIDYKGFVQRHKPSPSAISSFNPKLLQIMSKFVSDSVTFISGAEGTPSLVKAPEGVLLINPQDLTEIALPEMLL